MIVMKYQPHMCTMMSVFFDNMCRNTCVLMGLFFRGSVYQYPTTYYLHRQRQPWSVTGGLLRDCFPCLQGKYFAEPMLEAHAGSQVQLKNYVEDIEQVIYDNRFLDNFGRGICWRLLSSGIVCFLLLSAVILLGSLKALLGESFSERQQNVLILLESIIAVALVLVRVLQTLVLYWKEREIRHSLEVTSWDDGSVTRGRPLTLFILMWIYASVEVIVASAVIFGNIFCYLHHRPKWTLFTTVLPVFLVSEHFSAVLQRKLEVWHGLIKEDQSRLVLLEANKILQEMWSKMPDSQTRNKIYAFKEAVCRSFNLESFKLSYIVEK